MAKPSTSEHPRPVIPAGAGIPEVAPGGSHEAGVPGSIDFEPAEALPTDLPRIRTFGVVLLAIFLMALLGGLFLLGYRPYRAMKSEILADATEARDAQPIVTAVRPRLQDQAVALELPAQVQSWEQTAIYPRANGYLKRYLVDIGDRVEAGQLLAEIDTPEVDAQLSQARAAVEQAKANIEKAATDLALAQTTWKRYENVGSGGVSQQELDEKRTQVDQAKAGLNVARANLVAAEMDVKRLEALQGFQKVTAPFAGRISTRNYDVGALLSPGNSGPGKELFQVDRTDKMRVFVKVPQGYATGIKEGQTAELAIRNYPGRPFEGKVSRFAATLDSSTRTLRTELDVPNREGLLLGGMYGTVKFKVTQDRPPLLVPTSALVYDAAGRQLALVRNGKVHMQSVSLGRDLGMELEILDGLSPDDLLIANPGQRIREGVQVQIAQPRQPVP
jgi:RND family efflux transporter MFP subunit